MYALHYVCEQNETMCPHDRNAVQLPLAAVATTAVIPTAATTVAPIAPNARASKRSTPMKPDIMLV